MEKRDYPIALWVVSGIIGVLVRDVYSFLAKQVGFAGFYIWNIGASIFIEQSDIQTFLGTTLGFLVDLSIGAILGVVIGLILEWWGKKNYLLAGLGVGLSAWLFFYGILFHNLPYTKDFAPKDPLSAISKFIGHSIFGITTAVVYVKYLSRKFTGSVERKTAVSNPSATTFVVFAAVNRPSLWRRLMNRFIKTKL
ncbi:MAG: hypothetical protein ACYC0Q_00535 [Eubacteriales bacterium]